MVGIGGLNKDKELIRKRGFCSRCNHLFEDNEFKVKTDADDFVCEECNDKVNK